MSKKLNISALVDSYGKLNPEIRERINNFLQNNINEIISIELKVDRKRSNPQNRYYWGVVVPYITAALIEFGNDVTKDDVHEYLKSEFNRKEVVILDEVKSVVISTSDLTTIEFMDYVEKCCRFAAERLFIAIPPPEKDYYESVN